MSFPHSVSRRRLSIVPRRKEQEALSFEDFYKFRSELIEKGDRVAAVIAPDYPDAERVREEIRDVLETVETYEVVGKSAAARSM
jgi:hypothetical protein